MAPGWRLTLLLVLLAVQLLLLLRDSRCLLSAPNELRISAEAQHGPARHYLNLSCTFQRLDPFAEDILRLARPPRPLQPPDCTPRYTVRSRVERARLRMLALRPAEQCHYRWALPGD